MEQLRIRGLVSIADRIRRELAQPISWERKQELRRQVADTVQQLRNIVDMHGTTLEALHSRSRRAYEFLAGLDFDAIASVDAEEAAPSRSGTVRLPGLQSEWEAILDTMTRVTDDQHINDVFHTICRVSQNIERVLEEQGYTGRELTPQTATARGWLAFFAQREQFDAYVMAIRTAAPILEATLIGLPAFTPPADVHFRPTRGLYRLRRFRDATRVTLPTPMLTFSDAQFELLGQAVLGSAGKEKLLEAISTDECQSIQAELESLGGIVEESAGIHHHLEAAFARVNDAYFEGSLARPGLTWSRSFTGCKFGHYDPVRDRVMLSATLDRQDVPGFLVDYILYHELLHKKMGADWRAGRAHVHTPEFRAAERRFAQYAEAEAALARLARSC